MTSQLRREIVASGIAGPIPDHTHAITHRAIRGMLAGDPYFQLGISAIAKADLSLQLAKQWVSDSLGISVERFDRPGPSYIDPDLTIHQLSIMLDEIDRAIDRHQTILLATGHPGSLLQFYAHLAGYISARQRRRLLVSIDKSTKLSENMWIDMVSGVLVPSDLGSLMHTHEHQAMRLALRQLKSKPGLVIADHGFAGAAIDSGIATIGLHDVDDPAIPIAFRLGLSAIPVAMNDNQRNLRTDQALAAVIKAR